MYDRLSAGCFFGQTLSKYDGAGLTLSESLYLPNTRLVPHSHSNAYFCVTLRGNYYENYGNSQRGCRPSTLVFHPAEETHANQFLDTGGHLFRLEITPDWAERLHPYTSVLKNRADFRGGQLVYLIKKLYRECRQPDSVTPLAIEAVALEIIATMSRKGLRPRRKPPRWIALAQEFLHEHFAEKFNPQTVSQLVDIHPVHLSRSFRKFYGCSMGEYVRKLRIDTAARKLATTEMPIAEVSTLVGFADQSHFSRNFKRITGFSPAHYRATFGPG